MLNILDLFRKAPAKQDGQGESNNIETSKTWFEERYEIALIQRNVMVMVAIFCLIAVSIAVVGITKISLSKEFDPFVIQIDDNTGAARVVNPISLDVLGGKEELSKYFMKRYLIARETYNPVDFDNYAKKVLRLLSTPQIYGVYLGYIRDKDHDPTILYGQKNTTSLVVKSWSKLDDARYIVRFSLTESSGSMRVFNKISVIEYQYTAMTLTDDDRDVNPVGFQVTAYRVDDDNS
jgi:type IV secretion system protein VirB8